MIDRGLERLLTDTARDMAYPATPDLSSRVLSLLASEPSRTPAAAHGSTPDSLSPQRRGLGRGAGHRPAFAALVAAVLVVLAVTLAITPSRDAIARLFGVEGSKIEFLPTPRPGETPTPFPRAGEVRPQGVESPIEIAEIPGRAGFRAVLPIVGDERTGSSIVVYGRDAVVVHRYERFELWQSHLQGWASFGKQVRPDGTLEEVEVGDVPGTWITGPEHIVSYTDRSGAHISASQRIVDTNTLIWRTDAFFYRLETDLPLEDALRIAETLP